MSRVHQLKADYTDKLNVDRESWIVVAIHYILKPLVTRRKFVWFLIPCYRVRQQQALCEHKFRTNMARLAQNKVE